MLISQTSLHKSSLLYPSLHGASHSDAFEIEVPLTDHSIYEQYCAIFNHYSWWMKLLLMTRTAAVSVLGISGPSLKELIPEKAKATYKVGEKICRWEIYAQNTDELVVGSTDKHLDFKVSVLRYERNNTRYLCVTTLVFTHNRFGRAYLSAILPIHKLGVPLIMKNAVLAKRL